jgi:hypothetical protein
MPCFVPSARPGRPSAQRGEPEHPLSGRQLDELRHRRAASQRQRPVGHRQRQARRGLRCAPAGRPRSGDRPGRAPSYAQCRHDHVVAATPRDVAGRPRRCAGQQPRRRQQHVARVVGDLERRRALVTAPSGRRRQHGATGGAVLRRDVGELVLMTPSAAASRSARIASSSAMRRAARPAPARASRPRERRAGAAACRGCSRPARRTARRPVDERVWRAPRRRRLARMMRTTSSMLARRAAGPRPGARAPAPCAAGTRCAGVTTSTGARGRPRAAP